MEKLKFNQIAQILTGFPFRSSINNVLGNEIGVIQAKNIKNGIFIDCNKVILVKNQGFQKKFFVEKNDVLLSARGILHAGIIENEVQNTIVSFSVYILRLISKKVKPEYLAIFLNSNYGQRLLNERSTGVAIKTMLRRDLENMKIIIPSLKEQEQIIDIYKNNQKQQKLLKQKTFLADKISQGAINKIINYK